YHRLQLDDQSMQPCAHDTIGLMAHNTLHPFSYESLFYIVSVKDLSDHQHQTKELVNQFLDCPFLYNSQENFPSTASNHESNYNLIEQVHPSRRQSLFCQNGLLKFHNIDHV